HAARSRFTAELFVDDGEPRAIPALRAKSARVCGAERQAARACEAARGHARCGVPDPAANARFEWNDHASATVWAFRDHSTIRQSQPAMSDKPKWRYAASSTG